MKLANSTEWPDYFLRRLVSWCCKELGLPSSKVRRAQFRNRTISAYSGHAYTSMRFVASVGPAGRFPLNPDNRPGMKGTVIADRLEALVAITAHELAHLCQYAERRAPGLRRTRRIERVTRREEVRVLSAFREQRDSLLAEWSAAPATRPAKPQASIQEKRAVKAQADLDRWQRKLKLAQTKIRKLKYRVRYYEHTLAAKRSN